MAIDRLLRCRILGRFAVPALELNWASVDDEKLTLLLTIRDNYYRYYQFYSNSLVAGLLWMFARASSPAPPLSRVFWTLVSGVLAALLLSARESWSRYATAVAEILCPNNKVQAAQKETSRE
ncbi:MAG: hypothetical protein ACLQKA_09430 [Bryobacteraceae bacterium]